LTPSVSGDVIDEPRERRPGGALKNLLRSLSR
jgi:hypothetical protein